MLNLCRELQPTRIPNCILINSVSCMLRSIESIKQNSVFGCCQGVAVFKINHFTAFINKVRYNLTKCTPYFRIEMNPKVSG